MKYAIFDEKGLPKAFYDKTIHGDKIPEEAIEITDKQWSQFINNQGKRAWDFENKQVIDISNSYFDETQNKWIQKTEDEIKQEKLQQKQQRLTLQLKQIFKDYRSNKATLQSQTINKEINARQEDLINIDGLISVLLNDTDTVQFRCADNSFVEVTKSELENIKKEIIQFGQKLYQNKWNIENQINNLTIDDIDKEYEIDLENGELKLKEE